MDLPHVRRPVPRHRAAARVAARSARTNGSTSAGAASSGPPWPSSRRDHAVVVREEEPDLFGVGRGAGVRASGSGRCWSAPRTATCCGTASRCWTTRPGPGSPSWAASTPSACRTRTSTARNVEFADAFDARIFIPRADQQWIQRPSPRIELFDDEAEPVPGLTLARIGGHFDGAAVLHWPAGSGGRGALLTGDTITVVPDRGLGELHVELPQPHPAGRGDRAGHRPPGRSGSPSTGSTAAGGAGSWSPTARRGPPVGRPLRGPAGRRALAVPGMLRQRSADSAVPAWRAAGYGYTTRMSAFAERRRGDVAGQGWDGLDMAPPGRLDVTPEDPRSRRSAIRLPVGLRDHRADRAERERGMAVPAADRLAERVRRDPGPVRRRVPARPGRGTVPVGPPLPARHAWCWRPAGPRPPAGWWCATR